MKYTVPSSSPKYSKKNRQKQDTHTQKKAARARTSRSKKKGFGIPYVLGCFLQLELNFMKQKKIEQRKRQREWPPWTKPQGK